MKTLIRKYSAILAICLAAGSLLAQNNVAINTDGSSPDSSAILDIKSTTSGLLIPRMTTAQRTAIPGPATGLMVYDMTTNTFWCYAGSSWVEVMSGYVAVLSDADGDTKIDVEESPDEDTIRFYTGGVQHFKIGGGRLEVLNTGGSVFLGEGAGRNDDLNQRENVAIGSMALHMNTDREGLVGIGESALFNNSVGATDPLDATGNTAIGSKALFTNTVGYHNTATGYHALYSNTIGRFNVANGHEALFTNTEGRLNTAVGYKSMYSNTIGNLNTAYGFFALYSNTEGRLNIAVGYRSMYTNTTGNANVAIGARALYSNIDRSNLVAVGDSALFNNGTDALEVDDATKNTAVGSGALFANTIGKNNTATGFRSLFSNVNGNYNCAFGKEVLYSNTTGLYNTAIGNVALYSNTNGINNTASGFASLVYNTTGNSNSAFGYKALYNNTEGSRNTAIGKSALYHNIDRSNLVAIGDSSLYNNGLGATQVYHGTYNTAVGSQSLYSNTQGFQNTVLGYRTMYYNTAGAFNTAVGFEALFSNLGGDYNATVGFHALLNNLYGSNNASVGFYTLNQNIFGNFNSAFGDQALYGNTSGNKNVAIGHAALHDNTDRSNLVAVGDSSLYWNGTGATDSIDATGNTAIGSKALYANTSGYHNTAGGYEALMANTTGRYNTAFGHGALRSNTEGILNTSVGYKSMFSNTTGRFNTGSGYFALYSNTEGYRNIAIGFRSMYSNTTGNSNVGIGARALYFNTDRSNLVAIGDSALLNNGIGALESFHAINNTAIGSKALYSNTTGSYNMATGYHALYSNTEGNNNTATGYQALGSNVTGTRNTSLGAHAGHSATGSGNVFIGYRAGYNEADSDKLYIHNDSSTAPLIYGEFDNALLRVNSKLEVTGEIVIEDSFTTDPTAGTIRWNTVTQDFEGYTGNQWKSLTQQGNTWGNTMYSSTENNILSSSNGTTGDKFGYSVAISGDYAIVGSRFHNSSQGQAYIFHRSGNEWMQQDSLVASDGAPSDQFGWNVDIEGDYAIVGAYYGGASNTGQAYIFHRVDTNWTEQAVLVASDAASGDYFGNSVAIFGEYAIVGAYGVDIGPNLSQGQAYIFHRVNTNWTEQDILIASDGAHLDGFGISVSIYGDYAVVGAHEHSPGGQAYIFHRSGMAWTEQAILVASDVASGDFFGGSVDIYGSYTIIGAWGHNTGGNPNQGKAYIYHRVGTTWTEQDTLTASDGAAPDGFGTSVSISGDDVIVGAESHNSSQGQAYIFHRTGTLWTQQAILSASDGVSPDAFGISVSISGSYSIIGAYQHDVDGNFSQGQAYIFNK